MTLREIFFYSVLLFAVGDLLAIYKITSFNMGLFVFVFSLGLLIASFYVKKCERVICFISLSLFLFSAGLLVGAKASEIAPNSVYHFVGKRGVLTGKIIPGTYKEREEGFASFLLEVKAFHDGNHLYQVRDNVRVSLYKIAKDEKLASGQIITIAGELQPLRNLSNPGSIDMLSYDYRKDIYGRLTSSYPNVVKGDIEEDLFVWSEKFVANIRAGMSKTMPKGEQAVLFGMLFGGYDGIDRKLVKEFSSTGIVHILTVSGAHVVFVGGFLFWLGGKLKLGRRKKVIATSIGICLYAILAGLCIPVIRATIMALMVMLGMFFDREADKGNVLGLIFVLFIVCQPLWLLNISFQLSFLSVLSLIYLCPKISDKINFLPSFVKMALAMTISVQLVLLPFLATYFYQVSVIAFLANIVILPIAEVCIILSFIGMGFMSFLPVVASFIFVLVSFSLSVMIRLNSFFANLSWAVLTIPHLPMWFWFCYYLALLAFFDFLPWQFSRKARVILCTSILTIGLLGVNINKSEREFAVHFIDVGQGDAALVITKNKKAVLIDTGQRSDYGDYDIGASVLLPYLKYYGIKNIELMILSHGHNDHAGGAATVAEEIFVRKIWLPKEQLADDVQRLLAKAKVSERLTMEKGLKAEVDGSLFEVVYAPLFIANKKSVETSSLVRVSYKEKTFLFTGDAPSIVEVAAAKDAGQVSVLKVSHHGSLTSSDPLFIATTNPALAVISVGKQNPYGHPASQVLKRFGQQGTEIARTDEHGAVLVEVKHDKIYWYSYRQSPEFFKR